MKVRKQRHEPRSYFLEIMEQLIIQEADFIGVSLLEHVFQFYLVDSLILPKYYQILPNFVIVGCRQLKILEKTSRFGAFNSQRAQSTGTST